MDTTGRLFQKVQYEASFLSASEEIEKFALEYAASHLPIGPEKLDFQSENLGKIPIALPFRHGFHGRRRLKESIASMLFLGLQHVFRVVTNTFIFHSILSFHSSSGPPNSAWGRQNCHRTWKRQTGRGQSVRGVAYRPLRRPKFVDCYLKNLEYMHLCPNGQDTRCSPASTTMFSTHLH